MKLSRLLPLIGISIFLIVLLNIDVSKLVRSLLDADILYISLALFMLIPITVVKVLKWKFLINSYEVKYPFFELVKAWLVGFSISMITPARLGDISRAYYLKDKISAGKGMTTVIIDRVLDVFILFVLGIIGILSFATYTEFFDMFSTVIVSFALFLFVIYLSTKKSLVKAVLKPFFRKLVPERFKGKINLTFHEFYRGLGVMKRKRKQLLISIMFGIIAWFLSIFQHYMLTLSLGLDVSYFFLLSIMPIVTLLDTLPISFSGLGTREVALIFFLSFLGIANETIVSFSVLLLIFGYLSVGLIGFLFWMKKPIRLKS